MCGESAGLGGSWRLLIFSVRGELAGPFEAQDKLKPGLYRSGRGPARVATGLAQRLFHTADLLLELVDFLLLCRDLGIFVVDIVASVLLRKGLLRVTVILHLRLVIFALEDIEFL